METLFELTFQDQTLNPQIGTFTDASQTTGTFTLEDGEYYLTNGDTKGFYAYKPIALQSGPINDGKVIIEFDLKVVTASVNTHTIIETYAGVDGNGVPTGDKITLQYNAGDIELVLGSGTTATLIESADVVVGQWYHFRIDCALAASLASTYQVKIDGVSVTTVTGATTDYELGIISVLGTDLHACDECGIKNITLVTETNMYVGRTALEQALQDVKGYVDNRVGACVPLAGSNAISGSLIPATDNSIDVGSSTKNIKMLYTKGITIDGTQFLPSGYIPRSGGDVLNGYMYSRNVSDSVLVFTGGNALAMGAYMQLNGENRTNEPGCFNLIAKDGTNLALLKGTPSGTLAWGSKNVAMQEDVIPLSGSNQISGSLIPATDNSIDIGSSTNNIKMLYTKGITIDGAQFSPSDYVLPTGSYIQFAGSQAPDGFLVCNGGAISRTTYSALFAVIGTTYGSGDGSTTFNLPNLTDRFLQGSASAGAVKDAGLPNITGVSSGNQDQAGAISGAFYFISGGLKNSGNQLYASLEGFDASRSNSIYGNSTTVQPPALTCLICIKY